MGGLFLDWKQSRRHLKVARQAADTSGNYFFQFVLRFVKLTLINQADDYNVFPKMLGTVALKTTKITICKHIGCFGQRYCCTHIPE